MITSYKFWYITRDDDGFITEAAVNFFEGEITTELEWNGYGEQEEVTRYRRSKRLVKKDLKHLDDKYVKDKSDSDSKLYHPSDFGQIKTERELAKFLNKELEKDSKRTPEDAQKVLLSDR